MLLQDSMPLSFQLVEKAEDLPDGRVRIRGKFQHCGVKNRNGRIYPRPVWERHLKADSEFVRGIRQNRVFGHLEHPDDGRSNLNLAAIKIEDIKIKENGEIVGQLATLSTEAGQKAAALFRDGMTVGISSRGHGSVVKNSEGVDEVQEDFVPIAFDLVAEPSTPGADLVKETYDKYVGSNILSEGKAIPSDVRKRVSTENARAMLLSRIEALEFAVGRRGPTERTSHLCNDLMYEIDSKLAEVSAGEVKALKNRVNSIKETSRASMERKRRETSFPPKETAMYKAEADPAPDEFDKAEGDDQPGVETPPPVTPPSPADAPEPLRRERSRREQAGDDMPPEKECPECGKTECGCGGKSEEFPFAAGEQPRPERRNRRRGEQGPTPSPTAVEPPSLYAGDETEPGEEPDKGEDWGMNRSEEDPPPTAPLASPPTSPAIKNEEDPLIPVDRSEQDDEPGDEVEPEEPGEEEEPEEEGIRGIMGHVIEVSTKFSSMTPSQRHKFDLFRAGEQLSNLCTAVKNSMPTEAYVKGVRGGWRGEDRIALLIEFRGDPKTVVTRLASVLGRGLRISGLPRGASVDAQVSEATIQLIENLRNRLRALQAEGAAKDTTIMRLRELNEAMTELHRRESLERRQGEILARYPSLKAAVSELNKARTVEEMEEMARVFLEVRKGKKAEADDDKPADGQPEGEPTKGKEEPTSGQEPEKSEEEPPAKSGAAQASTGVTGVPTPTEAMRGAGKTVTDGNATNANVQENTFTRYAAHRRSLQT